jgi:hypothetical protein
MRRDVIPLAALQAALRRCRARSVPNHPELFGFFQRCLVPAVHIRALYRHQACAPAMRGGWRSAAMAPPMTKMQAADATQNVARGIYFMLAAHLPNYFLAALVT